MITDNDWYAIKPDQTKPYYYTQNFRDQQTVILKHENKIEVPGHESSCLTPFNLWTLYYPL